MAASGGWSRRDRCEASDWPTPWSGPDDTPWPKPHVPRPIDPSATGVMLLCWRGPNGALSDRMTRWPNTDTEVPCPCGPACEGRHALVFADHGRVRVRGIHEPPRPNLADELRKWELYRKRRSSGLWPKEKRRVATFTATTPPTPRQVHAMPPRREIHAAAESGGKNRAAYTNPEPQVETSPNDWRQRWARRPSTTTG